MGRVIHLTGGDYLGKLPVVSAVQIVGVVRNERTTTAGNSEPPIVYVPLPQAPQPSIKLLIRSRGDDAAVVPIVRRVLGKLDPNLPLADVAALHEIRDDTLSGTSRPAWLIGTFAALAVTLSAIGLYGVVSYSITQRRREFGIRVALGAGSWDVLSHVSQNALWMVGFGLGFGIVGVFALTRVLTGLLFEVSPLDPFSLLGACVLTAAIALSAGILPARRAMRFDPVASLRDGD